jgi:transcription initiation factor TFIID subunit 9B
MASPSATARQNGHPHPTTPPPSDTAASRPDVRPSEPEAPLTSLDDDGTSKRPRDARLIHMVLESLGIHSYQERVPLQLLDLAYRYTSGVLSDAQRLSAEGYAAQAERTTAGGGGRGRGAGADSADGITVTSLRQAIASRQGHSFQGHLPKDFMLEQAAERNKVQLPRISNRSYGVQLPPEKHCLTGAAWNLREEWDSGDEGMPDGDSQQANGLPGPGPGPMGSQDERMGGMDGAMDEMAEDEEGAGRMEDVFGEDAGGGDSMVQD